jgi:hypothetical protein
MSKEIIIAAEKKIIVVAEVDPKSALARLLLICQTPKTPPRKAA